MKRLKQILSGVFIAALVAVSAVPAQKAEAAVPELSIASKDNKVPVYQAGKAQKWTLVVSNHTGQDMGNVVIAPELGDTGDAWPFQTDFQSYRTAISIPANSQKEVVFEFTQREDVPTARYTLVFKGYIGDDQEAKVTQNFYVNTTAKPEEKKDSTPGGGSDQPQAVYAGGDEGIEAGGFSNGGASFSGGGSEGSGSVPRVIVTGFTTDRSFSGARTTAIRTTLISKDRTGSFTAISGATYPIGKPSWPNIPIRCPSRPIFWTVCVRAGSLRSTSRTDSARRRSSTWAPWLSGWDGRCGSIPRSCSLSTTMRPTG